MKMDKLEKTYRRSEGGICPCYQTLKLIVAHTHTTAQLALQSLCDKIKKNEQEFVEMISFLHIMTGHVIKAVPLTFTRWRCVALVP